MPSLRSGGRRVHRARGRRCRRPGRRQSCPGAPDGGHDRLRTGGSQRGGEDMQGVVAVTGVGTGGPGLGQPVRVEQQRVAGGETAVAVVKRRSADAHEQSARGRQVGGRPVGAQVQCGGVAAAGEGHGEALARGARSEDAEDEGAVARVVTAVGLVQGGVEGADHGDRVGIVDGGGPQGVADQRRHGGRGRPLAAHVPQEEAPAPVPQGEQVVEVAAEVVAGSGVVVRGGPQPRDRRQGRRQQTALERGDHLLEACAFAVGLLPGTQQLRLVGRRSRASKRVVRTSRGSPSGLVLSVEVTSTGSRVPSAALSSRAMPLTSPWRRSSGAKWVS